MKFSSRILFGLVASITLSAAPINVGLVSFDNVQPGVNAFSISNFTGDPALGGFALGAPDFPVYSAVTLLASSLTVFEGSAGHLIFLGDIAPGAFTSDALSFSDTAQISSAVFTATLSETLLMFPDGSTHLAGSDISISLLPSSGPNLAGGDLALLQATEASPVSEPAPAEYGAIGLLMMSLGWRKRKPPTEKPQVL